MTEHFKAPEKIQLSEEEIANLSGAQFNELPHPGDHLRPRPFTKQASQDKKKKKRPK